jgi:pyruvate,water dikinase
VLGLVKVLIPAKRAAQNPAADALNELMAHPALRIGWLRRLAVAAVEGSRTGTAFRDDSHFYLTSLLPTLRRAYAELGERLHEAGVIQQPSDVYQLRFEELSGIRDPARLQPEQKRRYSDAVAARAARRAELEGVPLLDADALFAGRQAAAGALVTGMGASRGTATGRVRVITGPSGFGTLRSGEILVCPYTNPAWTPLFQRAAGVVVDAGGMASHAAIVAREYGVPAVMGTGTGTQVLTDGQLVTVDGTRGIVTDARI